MNGQMYQICSIVAAVKKALQYHAPISYTLSKYENAITFSCLPQGQSSSTEKITAPSVETWYETIKSKKLRDSKLLCPTTVPDRTILGFSNTTGSSILCFYEDGTVSCFVPDWRFDSEKKLWNILYSEQNWPDPPHEAPRFADNTDSFREVLTKIRDFALRLACGNFADIFDSAKKLLDGDGEYPDQKYGLPLPQIPPRHLQLFEAASLADVFGAMGSWNDSPLWVAQEKGFAQEYEALSDELLKNIRLAVLYAVNEW